MSKRNSVNKKLREEEQQAIGAIYKQYIDTFQENSDIPRKTFVKSDTLYAGTDQGKQNIERGQLYNPKPIIKYKKEEPVTRASSPPSVPCKRSNKKKSNLKSLGDELKMLQYERQAREVKLLPKVELTVNQEGDYTNSTNLFVSNLSPHITENHLIEIFGCYGPLASVKIMWPRNEPSKSANCGFVAFMSRVDAERALQALKNHQDMRINWGKSVKIPPHPVHIPPELYKLYSPPPPSGLPFNAQISTNSREQTDPNDNILANTTIKVTIPFDRNLLMTIHRTIEFVIREGPEFEALLMGVEAGNPQFIFLTDFRSPAHTYYRWKLYSILNGDPKNSWSMKPFRMYKGGSIWIPPIAPNYKDGMPKELINKEEQNLSDAQVDKLVDLIKNLTMARESIGTAMVFCLNHANAIDDVLDIILDSFKNPVTKPTKKLARLYLLSDVIYNCKMKKIPVRACESNPDIYFEVFRQMHNTHKSLTYPQDRECLKMKVLMVLRAWALHSFYDIGFITKLENMFLYGCENGEDDDNSLNDEPLDGTNLLKRSLQTTSSDCFIVKKNCAEVKFIDMFNPSGSI